MDVSDRRMQVQLTQEAKIISDFYSIRAIFAFVGFVNGLGAGSFPGPVLLDAFRLRPPPTDENAPALPRFRR